VASKQRVDGLDASQRVTYARADRFPRALRLIAESPLATAEPSCRAEFVDERVSLGVRAFRPAFEMSAGYRHGADGRLACGRCYLERSTMHGCARVQSKLTTEQSDTRRELSTRSRAVTAARIAADE